MPAPFNKKDWKQTHFEEIKFTILGNEYHNFKGSSLLELSQPQLRRGEIRIDQITEIEFSF